MTVIRAELAAGFMFGDDAVLLAMDGDGVTAFATALREAYQQGTWRLEHDGVSHEIFIDSGESDIDLDGTRVVWRHACYQAEFLRSAAGAKQVRAPRTAGPGGGGDARKGRWGYGFRYIRVIESLLG